MRLLYIAVHEQNKDWGAEHFLAKAFLSLGVDLVTIDYRKQERYNSTNKTSRRF